MRSETNRTLLASGESCGQYATLVPRVAMLPPTEASLRVPVLSEEDAPVMFDRNTTFEPLEALPVVAVHRSVRVQREALQHRRAEGEEPEPEPQRSPGAPEWRAAAVPRNRPRKNKRFNPQIGARCRRLRSRIGWREER